MLRWGIPAAAPSRCPSVLRVPASARGGAGPSRGTRVGERRRSLAAAAAPALSREAAEPRCRISSARPSSLCRELPRHRETGSCVRPNPRANKAWLSPPRRRAAVQAPSRITFLRQAPPLRSLFSLGGICCADSTVLRVAAEQGWEEDPGPLNRLACGSHGSGPAVPFSSCPHSQELFAELRAPVQNCFSKEPLSA